MMASIKTRLAAAALAALCCLPFGRSTLAADAPEKVVVTATDDTKANTLTDDEKKAGWKLLFDGTSMAGWHTFKKDTIRPGWQLKDGTLACADPHNAGDLCTNEKYDWFELQLDYNISVGGNSGIMFHVTDKGGAVWATGPEFQLEDNEIGRASCRERV